MVNIVVAMFRLKFLFLFAVGLVTTFGSDLDLSQEFNNKYLKFTANLYQELLKTSTGNLLISPIAIDVILATVHAGVKGNTAKQLINGLNLPESSEIIQQTFNTVIPTLQGSSGYNSRFANKIYVQRGYKINDTYKTTANQVFQVDIGNINFKQQEKAVKIANSWVKKKTYNLIDDVISQDDFDDDTSMLLISTMYFQEAMRTFNKLQTEKRDFYLSENDIVKVDMMQTVDHFQYYESNELQATFLQLNEYFGSAPVKITFVLPNDIDGLADLETEIEEVLAHSSFLKEYVKVTLPKFKIKNTIKLKSSLQSLGIVDVFEDEADFAAIDANQNPLKISNIFQKVVIELKEDGINAEYIPNNQLKFGFASYENSGFPGFTVPLVFQADHPFLFYIEINGAIVFIGRLNSFSSVDRIIQKSTKSNEFSSTKKQKKSTEEEMISIIDEYTCPCNLN